MVFSVDNYTFFEFNYILEDIRNSFLTEVENLGILDDIQLKSRIFRQILRHCTIESVLKVHKDINFSNVNVILINLRHLNISSGGLFDSIDFIKRVLDILDMCKRKIPILIKKVDTDNFLQFLRTSEGEYYLREIDADKDRLKKSVYSFKKFKKFMEDCGLTYLFDEISNNSAFKVLFMA